MKKTDKKTKWKYGLIAIFFIVIMTAPSIYRFIDLGIVEKNEQKSWYDPRLSDFLYDDTVDETSYNFNAYGESYAICMIQNIDYTTFTLDAIVYNVSYGLNMIPINFGNENISYTLSISQEDVNNNVFDWISIEPLCIKSDAFEANLDTTTDITFEAAGLISLLVQPNFSYNWLYIEIDGTVINNIYDTDTYLEVDTPFLISSFFNGMYLQYDLNLVPGEHVIKFLGDGEIEYKIVVSSDWDQDYLSDVDEYQRMELDEVLDPTKPNVWGFYDLGNNFIYFEDEGKLKGVQFNFYIPEKYSKNSFVSFHLVHGNVSNIRIDNDDLWYKDEVLNTGETGFEISKYMGNFEEGFHSIYFDYTTFLYFSGYFTCNGTIIYLPPFYAVLDSDSDGIPNTNEDAIGSNSYMFDSDLDGLIDTFDTSPITSLTLGNDEICQLSIDHNSTKNTLIDIQIERPENDYFTPESMIWKEETSNALEVLIYPTLRLFGNSSISISELEDTWNKNVIVYDLSGSSGTYGDAIPESENENDEFTLVIPKVSDSSFRYEFKYEIGHSAKSDSKINIRFDVIWTVFALDAMNKSSPIHFYNFDDDVNIQSISKKEIANVTYILASPDSMIENQLLWNLVKNPTLGSFSYFDVLDDIDGNGEVDFLNLSTYVAEDRETNPISVDETGKINETEVLYVSGTSFQYDILQKIINQKRWTDIPDTLNYLNDLETFFSFYSIGAEGELDTSSFTLDIDIGDQEECYFNSWNNYSLEIGGYEKRMSIASFPVFMNRTSDFQDGEVLEIANVYGSAIPLNEFPESINDIDYDKLMLINSTTIEKNDDSVGIPNLAFDYENDIYKETDNTRRQEVPLSTLIFTSYSFNWAEFLVKWQKNLYELLTKIKPLYPYSIVDGLTQIEISMELILRDDYGIDILRLPNLFGQGKGLIPEIYDREIGYLKKGGGVAYRSDDWFRDEAWNLKLDDAIRLEAIDEAIKFYKKDLGKITGKAQSLLAEIRWEEDKLKDYDSLTVKEKERYNSRKYAAAKADETMVSLKSKWAGNLVELERLQYAIHTRQSGKIGKIVAYLKTEYGRWKIKNVIMSSLVIFAGLITLYDAAVSLYDTVVKSDSVLEFGLRLSSAIAKIYLAHALLSMGSKMMKLRYVQFLSEGYRSIKESARTSNILYMVVLSIDYFIGLYEIFALELPVGEFWTAILEHTVEFLMILAIEIIATYINPILGLVVPFFIMIWSFFDPKMWEPIARYNPSMTILNGEGQTFLSFDKLDLKRQGGLEVGDTVTQTISLINDGNVKSYGQFNFSAGESAFSAYQGNWSSGYNPGYGDTLEFSRTLSSAKSELTLQIGMEFETLIDSSREPMFETTVTRIISMTILDASISDFYNDLTENNVNKIMYESLVSAYEISKDTYQHNQTAEILDKLSSEIKYDFFGTTEGEEPTDWDTTKTNENEFIEYLRPDETILHQFDETPSSADPHEHLDDIVEYPDDVQISDYIEESDESTADIYGMSNPTGNCKRVNKITLYIYGASYYTIGATDTFISWRYNDTSSWIGYEMMRFFSEQQLGWEVFSWSSLDEPNDLKDLQVRFYCEEQTSQYDTCHFHTIYAKVEYESTGPLTQGVVSEYKGHTDVMNVTCIGQSASTEFYHDIYGESPQTGIIDFWMCKDNYSNVIFDKFIQIDVLGSILNYDGTSYIRKRPINIDEWTYFSVNFDSDSFDLYINGVKCGNDITRESGVVEYISFTVFNDYGKEGDQSMGNVSITYFDAIDYYTSSNPDYYQWRSFAWDYTPTNITYYQGLRDVMTINTSISTDLRENIVEMSTSTHIADFDFDFDLVGTENPTIDIELFNIPDGFEVSTYHIDQNLEDEVSFTITNTDGLQYAGTYFFEMNVTLNGDTELIYHEIIPFIIPYVEDLSFEQQNIIYEDDTIETGRYTATYDFLDESPGSWNGNEYFDVNNQDGFDIESVDGHTNALSIHSYMFGHGILTHDYSPIIHNETIEFYIRFAQIVSYVFEIETDDFALGLKWDSFGNLQYQTGPTAWSTFTSYESDIWYLLKIKYDVDSYGDETDDWHLWIDGVNQTNEDEGFDFHWEGSSPFPSFTPSIP